MVRRIASHLANSSEVKSLFIGSAGLGDAGASATPPCTPTPTHLSQTRLSVRPVGDALRPHTHDQRTTSDAPDAAGTELLSAAVGVCPSLTQLYMGHNGIGPKGAAKLAAALSYNTTLELLNLTNNHLGDEGVASLTACFEANPNTRINQLCLDYNGISAAAAAKLVAAMAASTGAAVSENMDTFAELPFLTDRPSSPFPLKFLSYPGSAIELALLARQAHAWSRSVPEDIFLNNVLPYANMDEPRDDWRSLFSALFAPIVAGAGSLTGAAQLLNERIWSIWGIEFQPDHTPEIMSPSQTISAGFASCTGLSIFLVDACRAVGIPARVAGTPDWQEVRNGDSPKERFHNHNWAEIWDGEHWSFTGAAEYNPAGFNRTWFFPHPATGQIPGDTLHAIYAVSFKPSDTYFPLIWRDTPEAKHNRVVHAEDVTHHYLTAVQPDAA
ncbi:MAG: hypothetical protein WDW36_001123 [Sanguina aurantia]